MSHRVLGAHPKYPGYILVEAYIEQGGQRVVQGQFGAPAREAKRYDGDGEFAKRLEAMKDAESLAPLDLEAITSMFNIHTPEQ